MRTITTNQESKAGGAGSTQYLATMRKFLNQTNWQTLVTLTFKYEISEQVAQLIFDKFQKRLNNCVYGRRSKKKLVMLPVLERGRNGGLHFHLLLNDPATSSVRAEAQNFKATVQRVWKELDKRNGDPAVNCPDGESWFEAVTDKGGAVKYVLKQLPYIKDVVQWQHVNLTPAQRVLKS